MKKENKDSSWWLVVAVVLAVAVPLGVLAWHEHAAGPVAGEGGEDAAVAAEPGGDTSTGPGPSAAAPGRAGVAGGDAEDGADAGKNYQVVWFAPWGDGPGELGKAEPAEGNPEGPASFTTDGQGRFWVLDQVNQRLVIFSSGEYTGSVPLEAATFQDLAIDGGGRVWLLDRLVGRRLLVLDEQGRRLGQIALEGGPLQEGGGVTGLFLYEDGAWVEVEHSLQIRLAGPDGSALAERNTRRGRLSADGRLLLAAALEGRQAVVVMTRPATTPGANPRVLARVEFALPVLYLLLLDSDNQGNVFLAAHLARFADRPPYAPEQQRIELVVLDAGGAERERLAMAVPELELESFRPLMVDADGSVYQLWTGRAGVEMRRVR